MSDCSIVNPIRWKFHSALIQVVVKWLLWNFVDGTTAMLSWHVQNFVAIWYQQWNDTKTNFPSNLSHAKKIGYEMASCCIMISWWVLHRFWPSIICDLIFVPDQLIWWSIPVQNICPPQQRCHHCTITPSGGQSSTSRLSSARWYGRELHVFYHVTWGQMVWYR